VEEVIAKSGLETWTVTGPHMNSLSRELEQTPGIDMIAPFGASLHVSGRDPEALSRALAPYKARADLTWERTEPSLEDVFIDLMQKSRDNFEQALA